MRDITVELNGLRLHRVASAWVYFGDQGSSATPD